MNTDNKQLYPLLDNLSFPDSVQQFTQEKLHQLVDECRNRIIEVTSKKGGHLASSLGTIELTVALYHVFNGSTDHLIWDVGHQAYSHKLLTGRHHSFDKIGKKGGVGKFLVREESAYDHFGAGHASTSISSALGIAVAKRLNNNDTSKTIAIIGDGALTGGLAFEGMNHTGHLEENIIVILNDNEMSIDPNVGALQKTFNLIQSSKRYNKIREEISRLKKFQKIPRLFHNTVKRIDKSFMEFLSPSSWFEKLGFRYFGPIDGHNLVTVINTLKKIQDIKGPILLHVLTKKGKGYQFAEKDSLKYHGVTPFSLQTGNFIKKHTTGKSYTNIWAESFSEIFHSDNKTVAISAAMIGSTGLKDLQTQYPHRIFDVGICEAHAVTFAAGLSTQGIKPFVCIYSTFLQRALDQLIHDVAIQKLPIRFILDRAGFVGADGATHHGIFDLTYLRMIPNFVILVPRNGKELQSMLPLLHEYNNGPIAIRFPRNSTEEYYSEKAAPTIKFATAEVLQEGTDITFFAVGSMVDTAIEIARKFQEKNISCNVINSRFVKPLDTKITLKYAQQCKFIFTLEENVVIGGFGSAIEELLAENSMYHPVYKFGIPDFFIEFASQDEQKEAARLDAYNIFQKSYETFSHYTL